MSDNNECANRREAREALEKVLAIAAGLDRAAFHHNDMMRAIKVLQDHPKSVWIRSDWTQAGEKMRPREFNIVLPTPVTEVRIVGLFDTSGHACMPIIEYMGISDFVRYPMTEEEKAEVTEFCRRLDFTERR